MNRLITTTTGLTLVAVAAGCGRGKSDDQVLAELALEDQAAVTQLQEPMEQPTSPEPPKQRVPGIDMKDYIQPFANAPKIDSTTGQALVDKINMINLNNHRILMAEGRLKGQREVKGAVLDACSNLGINVSNIPNLNFVLMSSGGRYLTIVNAPQLTGNFNYVVLGNIMSQKATELEAEGRTARFMSTTLANIVTVTNQRKKVDVMQRGQLLFSDNEVVHDFGYLKIIGTMLWNTCRVGQFCDQGGANPKFNWLAKIIKAEWQDEYNSAVSSSSSQEEAYQKFIIDYAGKMTDDANHAAAFVMTHPELKQGQHPIYNDAMARAFQFGQSELTYRGIELDILNIASRPQGTFSSKVSETFLELVLMNVKDMQKHGKFAQVFSANQDGPLTQRLRDINKLSPYEIAELAAGINSDYQE